MAKYKFKSEMQLAVTTEVEADTLDAALRNASWRLLHVNHGDREKAVGEERVIDSGQKATATSKVATSHRKGSST